jgi:mannose-6-phosphate isomerase-like protein (cupin superfamily)
VQILRGRRADEGRAGEPSGAGGEEPTPGERPHQARRPASAGRTPGTLRANATRDPAETTAERISGSCSLRVVEPDAAYGVLRLHEMEAVPVAGVRWKPVRRTLGIEAFGINAYTADAGEQIVEEHDERGAGAGGHEEVYVVVAGRATFTVNGDEIDAAPGTLVFVRDPGARRAAVAAADGTTVLALGAVPGEPFRPSPWEWSFAAEPLVRAGDHEAAAAMMRDALELYPDNASTLYNLACFEALAGRADAAIEHLTRATELDPKAAAWADGDSDLDSLRERPDFPFR